MKFIVIAAVLAVLAAGADAHWTSTSSSTPSKGGGIYNLTAGTRSRAASGTDVYSSLASSYQQTAAALAAYHQQLAASLLAKFTKKAPTPAPAPAPAPTVSAAPTVSGPPAAVPVTAPPTSAAVGDGTAGATSEAATTPGGTTSTGTSSETSPTTSTSTATNPTAGTSTTDFAPEAEAEAGTRGATSRTPTTGGAATTASGSVAAVAEGNAQLTTLVAAASAAGLLDALSDPSLVATIFAPTNQAFADLLAKLGITAQEALADTDLLKIVLSYHVVPGVAAKAADLTDGQELPTQDEGQKITVQKNDQGITLVPSGPGATPAKVVAADVPAGQAIVHVIDQVLVPANIVPPTAAAAAPTSEEPATAATAGRKMKL